LSLKKIIKEIKDRNICDIWFIKWDNDELKISIIVNRWLEIYWWKMSIMRIINFFLTFDKSWVWCWYCDYVFCIKWSDKYLNWCVIKKIVNCLKDLSSKVLFVFFLFIFSINIIFRIFKEKQFIVCHYINVIVDSIHYDKIILQYNWWNTSK
jgi:hypothetical protein